MTTVKFLALCGLSAVGLYLVATASGSVIDPSYSQLRQHVAISPRAARRRGIVS